VGRPLFCPVDHTEGAPHPPLFKAGLLPSQPKGALPLSRARGKRAAERERAETHEGRRRGEGRGKGRTRGEEIVALFTSLSSPSLL